MMRILWMILVVGVVLLFCVPSVSAQSDEPMSFEEQMAFDDLEILLTEILDKSEEPPSAGPSGLGSYFEEVEKMFVVLNTMDARLLELSTILTERIKTDEGMAHKDFMTLMGLLREQLEKSHANHMELVGYILLLQDQDKFLLKKIEALEKGVAK